VVFLQQSAIPLEAAALVGSAELYTRAPRGSGSVKAMGSGTSLFSVSPSGLSKSPKSSSPVSLSASNSSLWLISQLSEQTEVIHIIKQSKNHLKNMNTSYFMTFPTIRRAVQLADQIGCQAFNPEAKGRQITSYRTVLLHQI